MLVMLQFRGDTDRGIILAAEQINRETTDPKSRPNELNIIILKFMRPLKSNSSSEFENSK